MQYLQIADPPLYLLFLWMETIRDIVYVTKKVTLSTAHKLYR